MQMRAIGNVGAARVSPIFSPLLDMQKAKKGGLKGGFLLAAGPIASGPERWHGGSSPFPRASGEGPPPDGAGVTAAARKDTLS